MIDNFEYNRHFMHPGASHAQESVKKTEIKDNYGHTRFAVVMTDFDDLATYPMHDDLRYVDKDYQVEVISYCYSEDPLLLVSKIFEKYHDALRFYEQNVKLYLQLCNAETRHFQDISLYADHIKYQTAKCCKHCVFAKQYKEYDELHHCYIFKFKCMNNELFKADSLYDEKYDFIPRHDKHHHYDHECHHGHKNECHKEHQHEPHFKEPPDPIKHNPIDCHVGPKHGPRFTFMPVEPDVDPTFVCDSFKSKVS